MTVISAQTQESVQISIIVQSINIILPCGQQGDNMKSKSYINTKNGAVSIAVVLFSIIILSVFALGFMRLVTSEQRQTINSDLSQSAYDSALAGIEDGKIALLQYHKCLNDGDTSSTGGINCRRLVSTMQNGIASGSCDTVANALNRKTTSTDDRAVIIQETNSEDGVSTSSQMMQAYTCVKISEELDDYRTTLNSVNRIRMIPLRAANDDDIRYVKIGWFSSDNEETYVDATGRSSITASSLPVLEVRLIQADEEFKLSDFDVSYGSGSRTDRATVFFNPSSLVNSSGTQTSVNKADMAKSNNKQPSNTINNVACGKADALLDGAAARGQKP